jgi:hypothetical protein
MLHVKLSEKLRAMKIPEASSMFKSRSARSLYPQSQPNQKDRDHVFHEEDAIDMAIQDKKQRFVNLYKDKSIMGGRPTKDKAVEVSDIPRERDVWGDQART